VSDCVCAQFDKVAAALPGVPYSQIYGTSHLMRLFGTGFSLFLNDCIFDHVCMCARAVKMIRLVAFVLLPKNEEKFIIGKFTDLMK
jgi:hypothetical protein